MDSFAITRVHVKGRQENQNWEGSRKRENGSAELEGCEEGIINLEM